MRGAREPSPTVLAPVSTRSSLPHIFSLSRPRFAAFSFLPSSSRRSRRCCRSPFRGLSIDGLSRSLSCCFCILLSLHLCASKSSKLANCDPVFRPSQSHQIHSFSSYDHHRYLNIPPECLRRTGKALSLFLVNLKQKDYAFDLKRALSWSQPRHVHCHRCSSSGLTADA